MREKELHRRRNEEKRVRRRLKVLERKKVRRTFSLSLSLSLRRIYEGDKTLVTEDKKEVNEGERNTVSQLLSSLFSIAFIQNQSCFFHF